MESANPLLLGAQCQFPLWSQVKAEHVVPAITQSLDELEKQLQELEDNISAKMSTNQSPAISLSDVVQPLERLTDPIGRMWGVVNHLKVVDVI